MRWRSIAMDVRLSKKLFWSKVTAHEMCIIEILLLLCNKLTVLVSLELLLGNILSNLWSLEAWKWRTTPSNLEGDQMTYLFSQKIFRDRHMRRG